MIDEEPKTSTGQKVINTNCINIIIMEKKFLLTCMLFLIGMATTAVKAQHKTAEQAAQAILDDIGNRKISKFNWLTVEEAKTIPVLGSESDFIDYVVEINQNLQELINMLYEYGIKGQKLNWKDVKVTRVEIDKSKSKEVPELKYGTYDGRIYFKSNGKEMSWRFKVGLVINGEWRLMLPRILRDVNNNYIPDY